MAWTDGDLKILAAGLAIGGKYNHTHGTLPRVQSTLPSGTYWFMPEVRLFTDMGTATIYFRTSLMSSGYQIYTPNSIIRIRDTAQLFAFSALGNGLSPLSVFTYTIDGLRFINTIIIPSRFIINDFSPTFAINDPVLINAESFIDFPLLPTIQIIESYSGSISSIGPPIIF